MLIKICKKRYCAMEIKSSMSFDAKLIANTLHKPHIL